MEKQLYTTICEDCGKVFKAKTDKAFFCPKCVKERISTARKINNKNLGK